MLSLNQPFFSSIKQSDLCFREIIRIFTTPLLVIEIETYFVDVFSYKSQTMTYKTNV